LSLCVVLGQYVPPPDQHSECTTDALKHRVQQGHFKYLLLATVCLGVWSKIKTDLSPYSAQEISGLTQFNIYSHCSIDLISVF
jgi:hypothetical protein